MARRISTSQIRTTINQWKFNDIDFSKERRVQVRIHSKNRSENWRIDKRTRDNSITKNPVRKVRPFSTSIFNALCSEKMELWVIELIRVMPAGGGYNDSPQPTDWLYWRFMKATLNYPRATQIELSYPRPNEIPTICRLKTKQVSTIVGKRAYQTPAHGQRLQFWMHLSQPLLYSVPRIL
jgi:hypothetical protein